MKSNLTPRRRAWLAPLIALAAGALPLAAQADLSLSLTQNEAQPDRYS